MTRPPGALGTADRLRKLRAMSAGELWTRVRCSAYCRFERRRYVTGAFSNPGSLRDRLVPELARRPDWTTALLQARMARTARYFAGAEGLEQTRHLMQERFPAEHRRARCEADRVLRREFAFFGGVFRYGDRVDWHADPVTRAQWPRVYHRDVPVVGGDVGFGDAKYVWELCRHQFLIDLARVWAIEHAPDCSAAMRSFVRDWRAENPVGTGVAWACALEPAFRVLSWLWGYFLTLDDPAFDDQAHLEWLQGFQEHGWFLYRHLEYYTSPYNHLIGEACALYSLGVLFPEFREAPKWRTHGRRVLESRLKAQFYADGGSVEQSAFYHHATTGFYLLAALLGRQNGEEFSRDVWAAIERAIEFSMTLQQPDGTTPRIGGADDGKPIRMEHLPLWDFRPYQALGAVLFERADFKAAAGRFFEDALWLLGADGARRFDALGEQSPPVSRALAGSGYLIVRNRWGSGADYLCFDCGEQAGGLRRDAIPSAAHGHADCLSVIVWRGGRPVLVDAGFHCYNGPKAWQDHFRETAAHNTVKIDGHDQALHINKMDWSHTYTATLEACDLAGAAPWMIASHDGFRSLPRGAVVHRRAVWVRPRGYIVLCDVLEGSGDRQVDLTFQFAPGPLALGRDSVAFDGRADLFWFSPTPLTVQVHEGGEEPGEGWTAPSLGVKVPAPRLVLSAVLRLPATLTTILADRSEEPVQVMAEGTSGGLIRTWGQGWSDLLLIKTRGGHSRLESDALMAAWRQEGDRLWADGFVGGTYQRP